jgi:hypothetical protein
MICDMPGSARAKVNLGEHGRVAARTRPRYSKSVKHGPLVPVTA